MPKPSSLIPFVFSLLFLSLTSNLQAQTLTDPGLSQHNYKMPNKAARAKVQENGHFVIGMNSISTIQASKLSKYAVRPSSIVIILNGKKEPMNINPLSSVSNYKTQPVPKMQLNHEEYSALLN